MLKDRLLNPHVISMMFVKWKYTAGKKIGVKADLFLKIARKISNLNK